MENRLSQLLLKNLDSGEYSGRDAYDKIREIIGILEEELFEQVEKYDRKDFLYKFYVQYENASYESIKAHDKEDNTEYILLNKYPAIIKYIIERKLISEKDGHNKINETDMIYLYNIVFTLLDLYNYIYYYNVLKEKFGYILSEEGLITLNKNNEVRYIETKMIQKTKTRMRKYLGEGYKGGVSEQSEIYYQICNKKYEEKYGVSFELLQSIADFLGTTNSEYKRSWAIMVKNIKRKMGLKKEIVIKALSLLELKNEELKNRWEIGAFNYTYPSIFINPIIRISGSYISKGEVLCGNYALLRGSFMQTDYVLKGIIDIDIDYKYDHGKDFEKMIITEFKKYGYISSNYKKTDPLVGEIDVIAVNEKMGVCYVIEAKSKRGDVRTRKQINRYLDIEKEISQLDKKYEWVKNNLNKIKFLEHIDTSNISNIEGILLVKQPQYTPKQKYEILTFEQLFDHIQKE